MRSPGLTPRALSALATRLVLISNSAKLVRRPSNSNALALPRLFARARTISARFAGSPEADMFLPFAYFRCAELGVIPRQKQYHSVVLLSPGRRGYPRAARSFSFCALIASRAWVQSASVQSRN